MNKKVLCCILAAVLLVMAIPAFAEGNSAESTSTRSRDKYFSATTINKGYTFKDFAHLTGQEKVEVLATTLDYKDGGYDYFRAYTCDNNGKRTSVEAYVRVYCNEQKEITLNSSAQKLSYFNLRVDNADYKEGSSRTNTLTVAGTAWAK